MVGIVGHLQEMVIVPNSPAHFTAFFPSECEPKRKMPLGHVVSVPAPDLTKE
jgi:hypothetical protein